MTRHTQGELIFWASLLCVLIGASLMTNHFWPGLILFAAGATTMAIIVRRWSR